MAEDAEELKILLRGYEEGPPRLRAAVEGLAGADLDLSRTPGTWTIRQIVHHIADGDDLWKMCIKTALGNSGTVFSLQWYWDYPQDLWVGRWAYARRAIEPSLALFEANRRHVVQLLGMVGDAWNRQITVHWPTGDEQPVSVRWVVQMQTRHVKVHTNEIGAIRRLHSLG
jgi:hypothetical protein